MKQKLKAALVILPLMCALSGCGAKDTVYLETAQAEGLVTEIQEESEKEENSEKETQAADAGSLCYVYVCGAVKVPGVYILMENSRIYEAVAMAGGLTEEAGTETVNQAETITDGQMIRIPTIEEAKTEAVTGSEENAVQQDGKIDLNRGSASDLMTLPGIGQSKADSIIAYREKNGGFSSVEELMNVDGIKEGVFNRVKDHIKVN